MSIKSNHMPMDGIRAHIISEKLIISLSALITGVLNERYCYVSLLDN